MKTDPNSLSIHEAGLQLPQLTLRQYFAGLAMQGYISADYTANSGMPFDSMAEWSVKMADYLIAELNKEVAP